MRGRPTIYEDSNIVKKAQEVFWQKGYSATSLNDLQKATGAGAGSFYNTFKGGKKEVFEKAIEERRLAFDAFKLELIKSESPLRLIKDFFISIASAEENEHLKGCIIANTVVEMTFIDKNLEASAVQILKDVEQMFTKAIKDEKLKGNLKTPTHPEILGKYLITFWCGLNTLRRMYPDKNVLKNQIEMQLAVIS
ncbi:TetR family transcriptional regulator [Flavobacterium araucananum]|jgi:TetR/AcrR family transcriptional repressor of nem operon|uniref:TetR family transcriptional regulator n=1 Tax=Flavobacterium araucananum TaxID=946678 RepID=A0A227NEB6_9FLAO|nr:TetR/AcrR family transcriptional regulator [Flavobacterium araucananum]OXE95188.1 TetR family transcriptional regulator [Flavobacterium araucananum]PWJ95560.1 TetR family transcriptional regulator [Flavobacterium araucananum]